MRQMDTRPPIYKRRSVLISAAVLAVPVLALAWWLGSPLFLDTVVDEAFPAVADQSSMDETAADEEAMADAAASDETADSDAVAGSAGAAPVALYSGSFTGADGSHQGSGTATIYQLDDGSRTLRFEDFEVTNGPDLHVLISPTDAIGSREDLEAAGYSDLGGLKGNIGNQNYELPLDLDLTGPVTITIYCDPFHVVFATATLTPAA